MKTKRSDDIIDGGNDEKLLKMEEMVVLGAEAPQHSAYVFFFPNGILHLISFKFLGSFPVTMAVIPTLLEVLNLSFLPIFIYLL